MTLLSVVDPKEGEPGTHPIGQNSFNFHEVFGEGGILK